MERKRFFLQRDTYISPTANSGSIAGAGLQVLYMNECFLLTVAAGRGSVSIPRIPG